MANHRQLASAVLRLLLASTWACNEGQPSAGRFVVVGVDGGEWSVIEELWNRGDLPSLAAVAERGVTATLRTDYIASPVIWTTIATGVTPDRHGITGFVVSTPRGDVPVSSTVRSAPAIWSMVSAAGGRVAVLGWWASWPAEPINGIVVSDRALHEVGDRVYPPDYLPRLLNDLEMADHEDLAFGGNPASEARDRLVALTARRLAADGFDLVLAYFRSVDIASHNHWRHFRPDRFLPPAAGEAAAHGEAVPEAYRALDRAIGEIAAAAGPDVNLLVVSDHGFHTLKREKVQILLDLSPVLERLGFLTRTGQAVDFGRSQIYPLAASKGRNAKMVRYALAGREPGGAVLPEEREEIRNRLAAELARFTYVSGTPVFRLRDPRPKEAARGADLVVDVLTGSASRRVLHSGEAVDNLIEHVGRISGSHSRHTHGIFLAAGPDIDPGADVDGISIHDLTPTLLYGLGLPVAQDFSGRARQALFSEEFRRRHPLRTIPSWGSRRTGTAAASPADEEILDELRALGYLD